MQLIDIELLDYSIDNMASSNAMKRNFYFLTKHQEQRKENHRDKIGFSLDWNAYRINEVNKK